MPRLVWLEFPEELRRIVEPYLARELPILPPWVLELRLDFDDDGRGAGLRATVNREYRCGGVTFCGGWFSGTERYRRSSIRREFVHFALHGLKCVASDLIARQSDEGFREYLTEQLREATEMATVDVEQMLSVTLGETAEPLVIHNGPAVEGM